MRRLTSNNLTIITCGCRVLFCVCALNPHWHWCCRTHVQQPCCFSTCEASLPAAANSTTWVSAMAKLSLLCDTCRDVLDTPQKKIWEKAMYNGSWHKRKVTPRSQRIQDNQPSGRPLAQAELSNRNFLAHVDITDKWGCVAVHRPQRCNAFVSF